MDNKSKLKKNIAIFTCATMLLSIVLYDIVVKTESSSDSLNLPHPTKLLKSGSKTTPIVLRGISIDPENPLKIKFILDEGNYGRDKTEIEKEAQRLVSYFLSALTLPQDDLWVNLSPYEEDRIISNSLVKTEMGRDLLAQDYILKQLAASLTHPDSQLGESYWNAQGAGKSLALNKIWITPENAKIYADETKAIVFNATLAIRTAKDFNALKQDKNIRGAVSHNTIDKELLDMLSNEVNQGEHFNRLRQIYHSLLLANWFKQRVKHSFYDKLYLDKSKTAGITIDDPQIKNRIFNRYLESFNKGVFKFVRRDSFKTKRLYFSGGMVMKLAEANIDFEPLNDYSSNMRSCSAIDVNLQPVVDKFSNRGTEPRLAYIFKERVENAKTALEHIKFVDNPEINLLVYSQGNYGVMGKAVLLANSLVAKNNRVKVNVYVRASINGRMPGVYSLGADKRINIKYFFEHRKEELPPNDKIDVVFLAERDSQVQKYTNAHKILPYSYTLGHSKINDKDITELANPYGTLILDESLAKQRKMRDSWTKEKLNHERGEWLKDLGLYMVDKMLAEDTKDSIWTYAYVQKKESFEALLDKVIVEYKKQDSKFLNKRNPLVVHTVLGRHYSDRDLKKFISEKGIKFTTDEGYRIAGNLPITIVLHKKLDNVAVRKLTSQLCGTSIRNNHNVGFVDFPLLITGNASWLEALSVGAIWLHDNNDTLLAKKKQFEVLGRKIAKFAKETGTEFNPFLYNADNYLMETINQTMFENLDKWSDYAKSYTKFVNMMNMADELLIQLFRKVSDPILEKIVAESQLAYRSSNGFVVYNNSKRYMYNAETKELELDNETSYQDVYIELTQLYYPRLNKSKSAHSLKKLHPNDVAKAIHEISNKAFKSFPFVKTITEQRLKMVTHALDILKDEKPIVNVYIQQQGGNGVMGMASILADSILSKLPKALLRLIVIANSGEDKSGLFETNDQRKEIFVISEGAREFYDKVSQADLHLVVSGNGVDRSFLPENLNVIEVPGYAIAASYFSGRNRIRENLISNNVADPLGTLILNESLMNRQKKHDNVNLTELLTAREEWLQRYLSPKQYGSLKYISEGSYQPSKAIWSFGYFQESYDFLAELMRIKHYLHSFDYIENGKQLLINMVLGKKITSPGKFMTSLANSGVKVINSDGDIIVNEIVNSVPITVVVHESLSNEAVISNMIDLGGTCVRTDDNKLWIDYPVYITGQASWLEAISAAKLYVHDGNDTGPGVKIKQQEYLARKIMALKSDNDVETWNTVRVEVNKIYNSTYMHNRSTNNYKYKNLEEWTAIVRKHTKLLYRFNMADDIAIYLAKNYAEGNEKNIGGIALDSFAKNSINLNENVIQYTNVVDVPESDKFAGFSFTINPSTQIEDPSKPFGFSASH